MTKLLLPNNVNPYDSKEVLAFLESAGIEVMGEYDEVFQYLNKFNCQEWIDMGQRVFLYINTYDRYPGRRFVVSYNLDYPRMEKPVKSYIVHEYKIF